jgi:hypothetical protein
MWCVNFPATYVSIFPAIDDLVNLRGRLLLAGLQSNYMERMWLLIVVNIDIKEKLPYRTHRV